MPNKEKAGWSQNTAQRTLAEDGPGVTNVPCTCYYHNWGCVHGKSSLPPALGAWAPNAEVHRINYRRVVRGRVCTHTNPSVATTETEAKEDGVPF